MLLVISWHSYQYRRTLLILLTSVFSLHAALWTPVIVIASFYLFLSRPTSMYPPLVGNKREIGERLSSDRLILTGITNYIEFHLETVIA